MGVCLCLGSVGWICSRGAGRDGNTGTKSRREGVRREIVRTEAEADWSVASWKRRCVHVPSPVKERGYVYVYV